MVPVVGAGMDSGKYLNYSCPPFFVLPLVSKLAWGSSEYASVLRFLHSWLQETLPAYSSHLIAVVQPGLQLAWTYTNATVSFLSAHCACFGDSFTGFLQRVSKLEIRSQKTRGSSPARAESHCPGYLVPTTLHGPLQAQLPEALHQLFHSLKELLLLFHHSVLLPMWHLLLVALAQAQEYCHEACR